MALTTVTITYDISDLVGTDFDPRRTRVYATTNVEGGIVDTEGNAIRLGDGVGTLLTNGTGALTLWAPGTGSNPATWQTTIHVDYVPRPGSAHRVTESFGPFTVTASGDLADLIEEQVAIPTATASDYADDAAASATAADTSADASAASATTSAASATASAASATEAEEAAALAVDISNIDTSDDVMTVVAQDDDSDFYAYQTSTFSQKGNLRRTRRKLGTAPETLRVLILGDSTASNTNYPDQYTQFRTILNQAGMPLEGVLSANILEGANPGVFFTSWYAGNGGYTRATFEAAHAANPFDLIIDRFCLINYIRLGGKTLAEAVAENRAKFSYFRSLPNPPEVLSTGPAVFSTTGGSDDFGGASATEIQTRNDIMRKAHLAMRDEFAGVEIHDVQADLTGSVVYATHPHKQDKLHLNPAGNRALAWYEAGIIGRDSTSRDHILALGPVGATPFRAPVLVNGAINGVLNIDRIRAFHSKATELGINPGDSIYIPGYGIISLAGTASQSFARNSDQVAITSVGGGTTDYSSIVAKPGWIIGDRPPAGISGGKTHVVVTIPVMAANATADVVVTVTGATVATPAMGCPQTVGPAGVTTSIPATTADNSVTIRFHNTTASPTVSTGQRWNFWLAR